MKRRAVVRAVGATLSAALAGCAGGTEAPDPTVTAEFTQRAGLSATVATVEIGADRQVTYTAESYQNDETDTSESRLSTKQYEQLVSLVQRAQPHGWQESYTECESICPADGASYTLTLTVDQTEYTTNYYGPAEKPVDLTRVTEFLLQLLVERREDSATTG